MKRGEQVSERIASGWKWLMLAAVVLLALLGGISVRQFMALNRIAAEVDRSRAVTHEVDRLMAIMVDAETGQRGYLITGDADFLTPYRAAVDRADGALIELATRLADDESKRDLAPLRALVRAKFDEMAQVLRLFDGGDPGAASRRVRERVGKDLMDKLGALASDLRQSELTATDARALQARQTLDSERGFGIAALVVTLLLAGVAWSLSQSLERRRNELTAVTIARLESDRDAAVTASNLAHSESFNRTILDSSVDCIFVLSADGVVSDANRSCRRQLPVTAGADGVLGDWHQWWPHDPDVAAEAVRVAVETGEARFVARGVGDGELARWWNVVIVRIASAAHGPNTLVATARDVTDQRRADEERSTLLALERTARSDAERVARVKDEFVSTLSHELRTPLNAILGWVGVLKRDQSPDTLRKAVDVIDRNSRRQSQMIDDLLDVGRIMSGKLRLEIGRVELSTVIEEAVLSAQPAADAKGVRLLTALGSASIVRGDSGRLQQVVWNLLSNAIKFTPRGGQVQITLAKVNSQVHVQVSDTGIGIPSQLLPHVFERFRQEDGSTTRRHGGLGLGLSIVRSLVELHGGTVDAASEGENDGSTFTIRLPLALAVPSAAPAVPPVDLVAQSFGMLLQGLHVLVVDDEEDARDVVARLLRDAGATVTPADSAGAALRLLDDGLVADVIVSDVGMPDQDGYDFIREVRRLDRATARVPAAALTALARLEDRTRALLAGFQTHLAKPVDPAELVATVASLAGRTGRAS